MTDTGETTGLREARKALFDALWEYRKRDDLLVRPQAMHDFIDQRLGLIVAALPQLAAHQAPTQIVGLSSRMDGGLFIVSMDGAAILHLKNPGDGLRLERLHSPTLATHQGVKLDETGRIAFTEADSAGRQQARIVELEAALAESQADKRRLEWLETKTINVRDPLRHGSLDMFWCSPDKSVEGEIGPSDIRAKVDAALRKDPQQ